MTSGTETNRPSKPLTLAEWIIKEAGDMDLRFNRSCEESMLLDIILRAKAEVSSSVETTPVDSEVIELLRGWINGNPNPPDWHWSFDLHVRTVNLMGKLTAAKASRENDPASVTEPDGCPTEMAALKRFWREKHALIPPDGPMPSGWAPECLMKGCGEARANGDTAFCASHREFQRALNTLNGTPQL